LLITDYLTDNDLLNDAYTTKDKIKKNILVMKQIENNTPDKAMLGDFLQAIDDANMDCNDAHQNQMMQLLFDPTRSANFSRALFDLLAVNDDW
tara:strand:+ start:141579 stop:141857 length:279 start_codon:yes stop_codon:yes gene_type:complete